MPRREYIPPGPGDSRSPCPFLNALANHGVLPRDGKNITATQIQNALQQYANMSCGMAWFQSRTAMWKVGSGGQLSLNDLSKHNVIEHDASLVHHDFALGDHIRPDSELLKELLDQCENGKITIDSVARHRNARYAHSKKHNQEFVFGYSSKILAYGEATMLLSIAGGATNQEVDRDLATAFLLEERFPDEWQPPPKKITFWDTLRMQWRIEQRANELLKEDKQGEATGTEHNES